MKQTVSKSFRISGFATFDYRFTLGLTKVPGLTETCIQFVTGLVKLDPGREQGVPSFPSQKLSAPCSHPQDPGGLRFVQSLTLVQGSFGKQVPEVREQSARKYTLVTLNC